MPTPKKPCPTCDGPMSPSASQCRRCKPTYERTPETRAKMSAATKGKAKPHLKGKRRPHVAPKIAAAWTPEMREAARERGKRNAADPAWRKRIAESVSGDKNPRWRGGMAQTPYAPGFGRSLKRRVRERDGRRCTLCGATEAELGYSLSIHHSDYDKSNHDPDNLFSTCKPCNSRVNTNREVWLGYFAALADHRRQFGQDVGHLVGRKVVTQREGFVSIRHTDGGDVGPDIGLLFARL